MNHFVKLIRSIGIVSSALIPLVGMAQDPDSLRLSLPQLEQQVLERNFQLLAQRYQVDIAGAARQTAGLRPNPALFFQQPFYNPNTHQFFPYGKNSDADLAAGLYNKGAISVQLQQLIQLAGKRSKLVALAESNHALAQLAFRDILRTIRFQLHSTYANLYYDLQTLSLFAQEASRQQRLIESTRIGLATGGIAPYELTRLEVALRDLRATIANYQDQIEDEQATLRILLRYSGSAFIMPTSIATATSSPPALAVALDSALTNRPDNALAQEQINNAQRSRALENARRIPDLTLGAYYERFSNAFTNYTGLQVQMDLPIYNRNQGNIRAAELTLKSAQAGTENQQAVVQSDVLSAINKLNHYYQQFHTLPTNYLSRVQDISVQATLAYQKRVIGLLDYLDKIRTYQSAQLNYINLQNRVFQAQNQLNYVTNTPFF